MESRRKQVFMRQIAYLESSLKDRLSYLSKKEVKSPKPDKDTIVRKLKANIKAVNKRLRAITENERKAEEITKIRAEKAAALQKEKEEAKGEKPKKAPVEAKGKKVKTEKKPAPSKAAESPKEGKATTKKKTEDKKEEPAAHVKEDKS